MKEEQITDRILSEIEKGIRIHKKIKESTLSLKPTNANDKLVIAGYLEGLESALVIAQSAFLEVLKEVDKEKKLAEKTKGKENKKKESIEWEAKTTLS